MNKGQGNSGTAAGTATALGTDALQLSLQDGSSPERICQEIAGIFRVRLTEIALLQLDNKILRFLYPDELKAMGMIPLSSPSIAAHTALSGEPELYNNFSLVKHASVFETVKLGKGSFVSNGGQLQIHKIMSAPIALENKKVLGVLQISRKGLNAASSGPDFTQNELRQLQATAKALCRASFLQPSARK